MTVLRPVLVGLGVGAAIAFVAALLSPRRLDLRVRAVAAVSSASEPS